MTSKLTREQLRERARENVKALKMASRQHAFESAREEILADLQIAEYALACLEGVDSEPVAVPDHLTYIQKPTLENILSDTEENSPMSHAARILAREVKFWRSAPLYRHAQPAPERDQVRSEHAEWSQATFGNVGPIGPLKHLRREVLEVIAKPHDLIEWADMQFLLWDAQRRAGITDKQITQAMIEKLAVNKQREWPEPKDGEPRLHIKEQPAPVLPDEMLCDFYEVSNWPDLVRELVKHVEQLQDSAKRNVKPWEDTFPETLLPAYIDKIKQADEACRAAMLQAGNSPVIPDGWKLVPVEPNGDMLAAAQDAYGETEGDIASTLRAAIAAAPQEVSGE